MTCGEYFKHFFKAIIGCFKKYAVFSGRADRFEFWSWFSFTVLTKLCFTLIDHVAFSDSSALEKAFLAAVLIPSLAVAARRLHDLSRSGWWQLLYLIPVIGPLWMLIWLFSKKEHGHNVFGDEPERTPESKWKWLLIALLIVLLTSVVLTGMQSEKAQVEVQLQQAHTVVDADPLPAATPAVLALSQALGPEDRYNSVQTLQGDCIKLVMQHYGKADIRTHNYCSCIATKDIAAMNDADVKTFLETQLIHVDKTLQSDMVKQCMQQ